MFSLLLAAQLAHADWSVKVTVNAASTKSNGDAWDTGGGAPDLGICIVTASNTLCDPSLKGVCQDKFSCTFSKVIVPNGPFSVWVYDIDLAENDSIGSSTCKGKGDQWDTRDCDVSGRVRSVRIAR